MTSPHKDIAALSWGAKILKRVLGAGTGLKGLEDDVQLRHRLEHFPGALEPGRNDKGLPGTEFPPALLILDAHSAASDVAELVLAVRDSPATRRAPPNTGMEAM